MDSFLSFGFFFLGCLLFAICLAANSINSRVLDIGDSLARIETLLERIAKRDR